MWLERDNNYRGRYIYPTPRKHYHSPTDRTILDTALRYLIRVMTEVDELAMFSQFPFHFNNCLNIKQSGLST